ncbi:hypothetical protein HYV12_04280 [Candidatus Dojkabacteria bacterium]|nr:hypothetical protein [Candidatus Dojkabacteria bacterium]
MREEIIAIVGKMEELFLIIPKGEKKIIRDEIEKIDQMWESFKKKILETFS